MWFDCVERKRSAKLLSSTTAPCTFAAAPSFQACLRAFICSFCMCVCIYVYVCMCADMHICIYVHVCMYMYMYACIHMCMCMCMHICAQIVGLSISASACGQCHACACVFVCIYMRMHICVGIYICAFFCSECYMHFGTGVLGTNAWAGLYVTQVCFYTNVTSANTLATGCVHMCIFIYMYICMHMYMDAYVRL